MQEPGKRWLNTFYYLFLSDWTKVFSQLTNLQDRRLNWNYKLDLAFQDSKWPDSLSSALLGSNMRQAGTGLGRQGLFSIRWQEKTLRDEPSGEGDVQRGCLAPWKDVRGWASKKSMKANRTWKHENMLTNTMRHNIWAFSRAQPVFLITQGSNNGPAGWFPSSPNGPVRPPPLMVLLDCKQSKSSNVLETFSEQGLWHWLTLLVPCCCR